MKKTLSVILAAVMVLCCSTVAFADEGYAQDGTTEVSVDVPATAEPTYTIIIPADTKLTFGVTGEQTIGKVGVSNVRDMQENQYIRLKMVGNDMANTEDPSVKLRTVYNFHIKEDGEVYNSTFNDEYANNVDIAVYSKDYIPEVTLGATVSNWDEARPGTYKSTIKFHFYIWTIASD